MLVRVVLDSKGQLGMKSEPKSRPVNGTEKGCLGKGTCEAGGE